MVPHRVLSSLLEDLAAKTPAPGGGAAASIAGALAAALAGMVVAYSVEKKSLAPHRPALASAADRLAETRSALLTLADEDAAAYAALNELRRLEPGHPRRVAEEPGAVRRAVETPGRVLDLAIELLGLVDGLVDVSNRGLRSDLAIAAVLAEACAASAGWNVRINAPLLPEGERGPLLDRLERSLAEAGAIRARVEQACV